MDPLPFCLTLAFASVAFAGRQQCGNKVRPGTNGGMEHVPPYFCPLKDGDLDETDCCEPYPPANTCCQRPSLFPVHSSWRNNGEVRGEVRFHHEVSNMGKLNLTNRHIWLGMSVLLVAGTVTALLGVCIWSERCPLHRLCQREAKPDYLAGPGDTEGGGNLLMPAENAANVRVYTPNPNIKEPHNFV